MPLWPWWLGALAFAATAILHIVVLRRPLGVSGLLRTAISPDKFREERDAVSDDDLQRALEEATRKAFGGAALPVVDTVPVDEVSSSQVERPPPSLGWSQSVLFLVGLVGGGALAARLQPPSLVATACFFGTGIALSLLMQALGLGGP